MIKLTQLPKELSFMTPSVLLATFGGVGLLRPAPGTWGSIAAFIFAVIAYQYLSHDVADSILSIGLGVSFFGGVWASKIFETASGQKDNQSIVIDEVAGLWLTVLMIPWVVTIQSLILALVLFRLFDIFKPWPIRRIETRLSKGWDVMVDDIAAALYAGFIMFVINYYAFGKFLFV